MDKHRLAIPPVAAIPGMLSYVGIDNDAMRGRISKSQGFVRLDVSKDLPAPRSARDILVHRAIHAGHDGATLRACHGSHGHRVQESDDRGCSGRQPPLRLARVAWRLEIFVQRSGLGRRGARGMLSRGVVRRSGTVARSMEFVPAGDEDQAFLVEMARVACTLQDRPLPAPDAPDVLACLPRSSAATVIAIDHAGHPLGAAWWHLHEPSLLVMPDGSAIPEMTIAVADGARGQGIGAGLIEALASRAAVHFSVLALNVHLRNPATRLYMRACFRVAGKGRGRFGVAMSRELRR